MAFGRLGAMGRGFGREGAGVKGASSPVLWTPLNLSAAQFVDWWDPTQSGTITLSGSNVTNWNGRINGISEPQATGANQPTFSATALNGFPGMTWDGSRFLQNSSVAQPATWTAFAVTLPTSISAGLYFDGDPGGGTRIAQYLRYSSGALQSIGFFGGTPTSVNGPTPTVSTVNISYSRNSGSNLIVGLNGVDGTGTALSGQDGGTTILKFCESYQGATGDFILLNVVPSTSDLNKLIGWAAWKYGAASVLPGGFPYKSRAPYVSDP